MSKYFASLAALALLGTAAIALPANAAERQTGATTVHQSSEMSSQRRQGHVQGRVGARNFAGQRRYVAPRSGYRGYGYANRGYGYNGYGYGYSEPYGYYAPPLVSFGVGPFGLRLF